MRLPFLTGALALMLAGCSGATDAPAPAAPLTIGLYSTLPIAWNEADDVGALLADETPPHWALDTLRGRGKVVALDTLDAKAGAMPLPAGALLVLAQPRALSPGENVALDEWVRNGGRVLLFADPMLTAETIFTPGDPRRPQDVALLSPILARWGLLLEVEDDQPLGERRVPVWGVDVPVNLPGRFRAIPAAGTGTAKPGEVGDRVPPCALAAAGLAVRCALGKGRVLALADAALLENPPESAAVQARQSAFAALLGRALQR